MFNYLLQTTPPEDINGFMAWAIGILVGAVVALFWQNQKMIKENHESLRSTILEHTQDYQKLVERVLAASEEMKISQIETSAAIRELAEAMSIIEKLDQVLEDK